VVRAFAAMFLSDPHSTIRSYKTLAVRVGKDIFVQRQKLDPYYTASYALYRLEFYFRNHRLDTTYKATRFQILLALRLLTNSAPLPHLQSKQIEAYCKIICETLWDPEKVDDAFAEAVGTVHEVAGGVFDRDTLHTSNFTDKLIKRCAEKVAEQSTV
jgi:hypothetical protein